MSSEQPTSFGQSTGGGLATSENVKALKKSESGEGMTREQLAAKKAEIQKAQEEVSASLNK